MQTAFRINGYNGFERLALGKRAVVYSVRKSKHKSPVVLKLLLPHLVGDKRFMARFEQSVKLARSVHDGNIVNVLDYGRSEQSVFVVTERYEAVPLQEILAEHNRVPLDVALSIVLQLCHALEAAHAVGLVHRDVRPANVVITDDGVVKLANFALATDIGEKGRVTHAGKVTATPAYMSPEQVRGETLTPQSDIFSLGVVAYELVAARRPFGRGDFGDIVERIANEAVAPAGSFNPLVEPAIERILTSMLQKDPAKRYGHVSEVLMDLEEAMDKYGHRADGPSLAAFAHSPGTYFDEYAHALVEKMVARAPMRDGPKASSKATLLRYYQKLSYLDPGDEGAKREVQNLQRETTRGPRVSVPGPADDVLAPSAGARYAGLDPNAQYRVVLESIDTTRDNAASFALKLSMKLRSPLPRMNALVRNMPARVSDRLPHRAALALARTIEELGGRVRLDVCQTNDARKKTDTGGDAGPAEPRAGANERKCPKCGWVEVDDAEFCSVCLHAFNKTHRIHARELRARQPEENPLADDGTAAAPWKVWCDTVAALPPRVKIGAAAAVVVLIVLMSILAR